MVVMTREEAWDLLCEFTKSESLRRHALAVETCLAAYARKLGEDENKWSVTALLHDFDWEIHPTLPDHPMKGEPILAERGVAADIRRAILSHADFSGVPRESPLEKTLFACDELAGFLTACSYVKPGRSIHEVDVKSVRRKLKDKAFARSVNREDITNGAAGGRIGAGRRRASRRTGALRRYVSFVSRDFLIQVAELAGQLKIGGIGGGQRVSLTVHHPGGNASSAAAMRLIRRSGVRPCRQQYRITASGPECDLHPRSRIASAHQLNRRTGLVP
jgi:predicted hydrolase (HD superfamily)